MLTILKAIVRILPDDPLLVRKHIFKEIYVPRTVYFTKIISEPHSSFEEKKAEEARKEGFDVDPNVPDNRIVKIEWEEEIKRTTTWSEIRLCLRGLHVNKAGKEHVFPYRTTRQKEMRAELADALESPFSFIEYNKLIDLIKEEIEHWRNNNMMKSDIKPLVLVLLNLKELLDGSYKTYAREVFYIKELSEQKMLIIDSNDNQIEIELDKGVYESGIISRFIFFLPSNVHIFGVETNELLI